MPDESSHPAAALGPASVRSAAQVFVDDLDVLAVTSDDLHHLHRVLRLRVGEAVVAADGAGRWRLCRYTYNGASVPTGAQVTTVLEPDDDVVHLERRPATTVTVAFAPVKGDRPEWAVQKLTELGVDRIVVLRAARAVVRWDGDRAPRALERLRRVAVEAAAQSRRAWLPQVSGPSTLAEAAAQSHPSALHLADLEGDPPGPDLAALAVGPEGGWDEAELRSGYQPVRLAPSVLRAETATVAAGTLLCALRDRLVGPL